MAIVLLAALVLLPALSLIFRAARKARARKRLAQDEAERRSGIDRVLRKLLAQALNDGRRGFLDVIAWPEVGGVPQFIQLWPHGGGDVLLKRVTDAASVSYVIEIHGAGSVTDHFPPNGTSCDESWFRDRVEKLFEILGTPPAAPPPQA